VLARLGHDVVVVDQASFPSDTLSTHSGVVQLRLRRWRWGLLDEVLESGPPAIRQVTFNAAGEPVTRTIKHKAGVDFVMALGGMSWTPSWRAPRSAPALRCAPASP
jgi:hypothetical protein